MDETGVVDNSWRRARFVGAGAHSDGMATMSRTEIGELGERLAVEYLESLGLQVLDRNWRCRYGELDVVVADRVTRTVMFVEVAAATVSAPQWKPSPRSRCGGCAGWPRCGWRITAAAGRISASM